MPMLQNMTIILYLTLELLERIKVVYALAAAGTPDQAALAAGISEALINTATGIELQL
jgi:biopolymer transport protein ExbB